MIASDDVRRRVFLLTAASVVALLAVSVVVVVVALRARSDASRQTDALRNLAAASADLDGSLVDQETAVRGYVITQDAQFLEPYRSGQAIAHDRLDDLAATLRGDRPGQDAVTEVRRRADVWRSEVAEPEIAAIRRGDRAAAVEIEASGLGKRRFDELRAAQQSLGARIEAVRRSRLTSINDSSDVLLGVAIAVFLFAVLYGALSAVIHVRWRRQRVAAEAERRDLELADERQRRWTEELASLSEELNRTESVDDLLRVLAAGAAPALGADHATIGVVDRTGDVHLECDPDFAAALAVPSVLPLAGRYPLAEAIRTRESIVFGSRAGQRPFAEVPDFVTVTGDLASTTVAAPLVDGTGRVLGGLVVHWRAAIVVDDVLQGRFDTLASLATESLRRGRLYDMTSALAEVSAELSGAPDMADVGRIVAEQGWRLVDAKTSNMAVLDARGESLIFFDPSTSDDPLLIPIDAKGPINDAVNTGRRTTISSREEFRARYPVISEAPRWAGIEAAVVLPIRVRGRVVAAIGVGWARPIVAAVDEASMVALAEVASGALVRADLFGASTRVSELAGRLAEATTGEDVARAVSELVPNVLGATMGRLAVVNDLEQVDVLRPAEMGAEAVERYRGLDLDAPYPIVEAIRTGRDVIVPDRDAMAERFPEAHGEAESVGVGALWAVPVRKGKEQVVGALAVGWPTRADLDPSTRALFSTVVDLCGATLERTHLYELEHELVTRMSDQMVRTPHALTGVQCAGRYQAALSDLRMGGDWYEFIRLEGGRLAAVVGDVVGHGVPAAVEMARFRTTLSTMVRMGVPLDDLFPELHPLLADEPHDTFRGTALCVEIDVPDASLRLSAAGHPPALLRTPAGVERVEGARYPALGVRPRDRRPAPAVPFAPGDVLVAFTDGLVETRRSPIDDGIDRVAEVLGDLHHEDVDDIADTIVGLVPAARASDDVAVVVLRNAG